MRENLCTLLSECNTEKDLHFLIGIHARFTLKISFMCDSAV